jgi:hypothetical protein
MAQRSCVKLGRQLRARARCRSLHLPSTHRQGKSRWRAPRTSNLNHWRLVCWAVPGRWRAGCSATNHTRCGDHPEARALTRDDFRCRARLGADVTAHPTRRAGRRSRVAQAAPEQHWKFTGTPAPTTFRGQGDRNTEASRYLWSMACPVARCARPGLTAPRMLRLRTGISTIVYHGGGTARGVGLTAKMRMIPKLANSGKLALPAMRVAHERAHGYRTAMYVTYTEYKHRQRSGSWKA